MALRPYLRLTRINTAAVTGAVPVWGMLAAAKGLGTSLPAGAGVEAAVALFAMGICAHIFALVHNEIVDREADAKVVYKRPKPLTTGAVSLASAKAIAAFALVAGLALAASFSPTAGPAGLFFAAVAAALAALYNIAGKDFPGGEAFLGGSIGFFALAGAAAVGGFAGASTPAAVTLALLAGLIVFFNTGFEGSYKDRETDAEAGERTLMIALAGTLPSGAHPRAPLLLAQFAVHGAFLVVLLYGLSGPYRSSTGSDVLRALVAAALVAAMVASFERGTRVPSRPRTLAYFSLHETFAVLTAPVLFVTAAPLTAVAALFLLPLVWYVLTNATLAGRVGSPDV